MYMLCDILNKFIQKSDFISYVELFYNPILLTYEQSSSSGNTFTFHQSLTLCGKVRKCLLMTGMNWFSVHIILVANNSVYSYIVLCTTYP